MLVIPVLTCLLYLVMVCLFDHVCCVYNHTKGFLTRLYRVTSGYVLSLTSGNGLLLWYSATCVIRSIPVYIYEPLEKPYVILFHFLSAVCSDWLSVFQEYCYVISSIPALKGSLESNYWYIVIPHHE